MKKWEIISIVLAVLLVSLLLAGCSGAEVQELEAQVAELEAQLDAKNPSYDEVKEFLDRDKIERGKYTSHATYTHKFLKNAGEEGIPGYVVAVRLSTNRILLFAGFNTSDKGQIYILPAIDKEVSLIEGKSYQELNDDPRTFGSGEDTIAEIMTFD